jgi:hypothetical protein
MVHKDPLSGISSLDAGKIDEPVVGIGPQEKDRYFLTHSQTLFALRDPSLCRRGEHAGINPMLGNTGNKRIECLTDPIPEQYSGGSLSHEPLDLL